MAAHGRYPSSQVVHFDNEMILIDCGEGTQFRLRDYKIKFNKINHILISHLHGDHYFGLIGLLSTMHLLGRKKDLHIYAPVELSEIITTQLKYSDTVLNYELVLHPLGKDDKSAILETKTFKISSFPLNHRIRCFGFRFDAFPGPRHIIPETLPKGITHSEIKSLKEGENILNEDGTLKYDFTKHTREGHAPMSYAYCSDTRFDEELIYKIKNVDLLYHEATFLHELIERAEETFHTTAMEAGIIASKADVGQLMIGHFSTRYKDPDVLLKEAKVEFAETILATEGETITITKP
jgi:ribonuclease Z